MGYLLHAHFTKHGLSVAHQPQLCPSGYWHRLSLHPASHSSQTCLSGTLHYLVSPQLCSCYWRLVPSSARRHHEETVSRPGSPPHEAQASYFPVALSLRSALDPVERERSLMGKSSLCGNRSRTESVCSHPPGASCSQVCNPITLTRLRCSCNRPAKRTKNPHTHRK